MIFFIKKTQEELEKQVEACRDKINEEKRRTREASHIIAAANQKTLQMNGDLLIAEKISQLKSSTTTTTVTSETTSTKFTGEKHSKTANPSSNVDTTKKSKSSSHSKHHTSSSPPSTSKHASSILNTHSSNPYHLNNVNQATAPMGRHASFNYNYFNSHHHPSHYPPNIAPPPPGYYPGPDYFNLYPDAEAFYNENSFYDISLRKNKSSSSLRNGIPDYQPMYKLRHPVSDNHNYHHHKSSKSRRSRSRSRSGDQSRSRSPPRRSDKLPGREISRKRLTRSRSKSVNSVDSLNEKNRSRSPLDAILHSKSKKKKSHHHRRHSHGRSGKEDIKEGGNSEMKKSKEKKEKEHHRSEKSSGSGSGDKERRSSHHKSSKSSKEHSKERSNNGTGPADSRYIPIHS